MHPEQTHLFVKLTAIQTMRLLNIHHWRHLVLFCPHKGSWFLHSSQSGSKKCLSQLLNDSLIGVWVFSLNSFVSFFFLLTLTYNVDVLHVDWFLKFSLSYIFSKYQSGYEQGWTEPKHIYLITASIGTYAAPLTYCSV